jgi:hypothetical protein
MVQVHKENPDYDYMIKFRSILKDINELHDWEMFKVFARLHPVEAYDLRPNDFCKFMRGEGYDINNKKIKEIIDSCR